MHLYQLQVLTSDVVVVLLHLTESLLVVLHQVIDMLIFPFLNLMYFNFESEFKFFSQIIEFMFILLNEYFLLSIQLDSKLRIDII